MHTYTPFNSTRFFPFDNSKFVNKNGGICSNSNLDKFNFDNKIYKQEDEFYFPLN